MLSVSLHIFGLLEEAEFGVYLAGSWGEATTIFIMIDIRGNETILSKCCLLHYHEFTRYTNYDA